jgi:hypothetical protein
MAKTVEIDTIETSAPAQEMALLENNEVALAPTTGYLQQPDFGSDDVFLSRLKLGQAGTNEVGAGDAKAGEWIVTGYPGMPTVTVVPLTAERRFRRLALVGNQKPVACYNHVEDVDVDCPNCRWKWEKSLERSNGEFEAELSTVYTYTVYVEAIGAPAILELASTSVPAAKVLNSEIMARQLGNTMVILGSKRVEGSKGNYYVATVQKMPGDQEVLAKARSFVPSS